MINALVEPVDVEEVNDEQVTLSWVRSLCEYSPKVADLRYDDIEDINHFIYDHELWLRADALIRDVAIKGGGRFSRARMIERLKNCGFVRKSYTHRSTKNPGQRKNRSYYVYPWNKLMLGATDNPGTETGVDNGDTDGAESPGEE